MTAAKCTCCYSATERGEKAPKHNYGDLCQAAVDLIAQACDPGEQRDGELAIHLLQVIVEAAHP